MAGWPLPFKGDALLLFGGMSGAKSSIDLTADSPKPAVRVPPPAADAKPVASSKRAASPSKAQPVAAKKVKPKTGCALLWIPHTCTGGVGSKVLGVYATRGDAEEARRQMLEYHEQIGQRCGRGDICVGDTWRDEISLVLRPATLFL